MCTYPTLSVPIIPADQSRASIWGSDLISPGVANGTAVALPSSRCSQRHAKPKDMLTLGNRAMQRRSQGQSSRCSIW